MDFEVQRCTRRCAASDRELKPGESFYSVLIADGAEILRRDFSEESWTGPPEKAFGWWKSKMSDPNARKVDWAPNDVILHYFAELAERPDAADTRYVLALLMVRRRLLRLEETETDEQDREILLLYCHRNETEYRVPVAEPTPARTAAIQEELAQLLFAGSS